MFGSFTRNFRLNEEVDPNGVKANFKDGVLEIKVPKTKKTPHETISVNVE